MASLPAEELTLWKKNIDNAYDSGMTEEDAVRSAVDQLMGKASTKVVVENAYARAMQEVPRCRDGSGPQNPGLGAQSLETETVGHNPRITS